MMIRFYLVGEALNHLVNHGVSMHNAILKIALWSLTEITSKVEKTRLHRPAQYDSRSQGLDRSLYGYLQVLHIFL